MTIQAPVTAQSHQHPVAVTRHDLAIFAIVLLLVGLLAVYMDSVYGPALGMVQYVCHWVGNAVDFIVGPHTIN